MSLTPGQLYSGGCRTDCSFHVVNRLMIAVLRSGRVLDCSIHSFSCLIDASQTCFALGALHMSTCAVSSNSAHLGHSAWSWYLFLCWTFPTGAYPASHFGTHNDRLRPSCCIAVCPASQSMDSISSFGRFLLLLQCSRMVGALACSYKKFRSHVDSLRSPIQRFHP